MNGQPVGDTALVGGVAYQAVDTTSYTEIAPGVWSSAGQTTAVVAFRSNNTLDQLQISGLPQRGVTATSDGTLHQGVLVTGKDSIVYGIDAKVRGNTLEFPRPSL